jgi:hypothetical protein
MIMTNKLLPVALIAALIGGSVGAFVMHSNNEQPTQAANTQSSAPQYANSQTATNGLPSDFDTQEEQTAYKSGFADGFRAAQAGAAGYQSTNYQAANQAANYTASAPVQRRTVYRTVTRRAAPQRVYYNYSQPRSRSFWQKHRDKLTVAMGAGGGAAIGALIGGKKGAAIGALAGGGGSALYTYKLRNRSRRY